ncbi:MAG: hypothetical protein ACRDNG_02670 [Gaiellaceae bacterium]
MRRELRICLVLSGIAVAALLFAVLRSAAMTNDSTSETARFHLEAPGDSIEAPERLTVNRGQRVELHVTLDVESPVHLHGYDITRVVDAG